MKIFTVAIIGLGNISHKYEDMPEVLKRMRYPTHLAALRWHRGFSLVAGCDVLAENRESFRRKVLEPVKIYAEYKKMLRIHRPDVVVIATPTKTHVKICRDVIASGVKKILCEKPIAYSYRDAAGIITLARKKNVKILFNYLRNFDQHYGQLIRLIQGKKFGPILSINVRYTKGIFNTATHFLALLVKIFGPARLVQGMTHPKSAGEIDPTLHFVVEFKDVWVAFEGIGMAKHAVFEMEIMTSKGTILISQDRIMQWPRGVKKIKLDVNKTMLEVYDNVYKHFFGTAKPACLPEHALEALRIAEQAKKS